jgi:hypothetical protein
VKIYKVTMPYFDGDHEHGHYESPPFATRELAEEFRDKLRNTTGDKRWWSDAGMRDLGPDDAHISEVLVMEECPEVQDAKEYRIVSWT